MEKKTASGIILTFLFLGLFSLAFNIQPVRAIESIYIRANGSIDPSTAPISRSGDSYSLTGDIYSLTGDIYYRSIVVEKDGIVLDGAGYVVQGHGPVAGAEYDAGISLDHQSNVTVRHMIIKDFRFGILLNVSSGCNISENILLHNGYGIEILSSYGNTISGNNMTKSWYFGLDMLWSSSNDIIENNFVLTMCYNCWIGFSSNNRIYHNNFLSEFWGGPIHVSSGNPLDNGYPSGGNYWIDYTTRYPDAQELDGSGIWDTPYVIGGDIQDNYPLMEPWSPLPRTVGELKTKVEELGSESLVDNEGVVRSLLAKLNTVQKLVDQGKIDEAKTILEEDFIPQVQNLSGIHITVEAADILIKSAEYIMSHP